MTALGRILQVIGWVWIALGFFGSIVSLPNVSVFPGIIILFISRVIRRQGELRRRQEEGIESTEQEAPRPLNTQRRPQPPAHPREAPEPAPMTVRTDKPQAKPSPQPDVAPVADSESGTDADEERSDLFERILLAGQGRAGEIGDPVYPESTAREGDDRPLSSSEMIARARRRWDRKP